MLTWLGQTKSQHYSILRIRKRNGSIRTLHNPDALIRGVQYRLLVFLLDKVIIPDYVYAFEKKKSIPTMAAIHTNKGIEASIDLKDFFHSITQTQVENILKTLGIGEKPARTISELVTYKYFVPQGGLTSPKIANIITAQTFGPDVKQLCDRYNLTLSIYADDITISTNRTDLEISKLLNEIYGIIIKHGFKVNHKKTKVMYNTQRQYVCGVVVNKKTNLIKRERYRLRAIVHNIVTNGLETEAAKSNEEPEKFASIILGKVNWMKQLNPPLGDKLFTKLNTYLNNWRAAHPLHQIPTTETPKLDFTVISSEVGAKVSELPFDLEN